MLNSVNTVNNQTDSTVILYLKSIIFYYRLKLQQEWALFYQVAPFLRVVHNKQINKFLFL